MSRLAQSYRVVGKVAQPDGQEQTGNVYGFNSIGQLVSSNPACERFHCRLNDRNHVSDFVSSISTAWDCSSACS